MSADVTVHIGAGGLVDKVRTGFGEPCCSRRKLPVEVQHRLGEGSDLIAPKRVKRTEKLHSGLRRSSHCLQTQIPAATSVNPAMSNPRRAEPGKSQPCFTDFPAVGSFPWNRRVNQKHAVHIVNTLFNHFYKFSISVGAILG